MLEKVNEPVFLTKIQASKLLHCGVRSLDKWRVHNSLPCVRIGNFVRFEKSQLLDWMMKQQEIKDKRMTPNGRKEERHDKQ